MEKNNEEAELSETFRKKYVRREDFEREINALRRLIEEYGIEKTWFSSLGERKDVQWSGKGPRGDGPDFTLHMRIPRQRHTEEAYITFTRPDVPPMRKE